MYQKKVINSYVDSGTPSSPGSWATVGFFGWAASSAAHLAKHSCFGVSHGFRGGLGLGWGVGGGFFRLESGFRRGRGSGIGNGNKGPIIPHESVKLGGLLLT